MNKKIAYFGGVGGQNSPNSPGGSPLFRGQGGGGSSAINDFSGDTSLDGLMTRTHKPNILGSEKPIESLLETFHEDLENDAKNYLLTFEERQKLDLKKKIRRKEQHLSDLSNKARSEDKVAKITKKLETVESLLDLFRQNNDKDFTKNASYYRRKTDPPLLDNFLSTDEEYDAEDDPTNLTKTRLTEPFTGITPQYTPEGGVDEYIEQQNDPHLIDMHVPMEGLINTPNPQENLTHSVDGTLFPDQEGSKVTPGSQDNRQPLEKKLQKLKESPPGIGRLDPDMFYGLDWDSKNKGKYPERGVANEGPWENSGLNDYSTTDYPDSSNNPYFSSAGLMR